MRSASVQGSKLKNSRQGLLTISAIDSRKHKVGLEYFLEG